MDEHGITMRLVPAGTFIMGGDPDVDMAECDRLRISGACERSMFEDEQPIHMVTLSDYYIDLTEVTNGMYALCVEAGVCLPPTDFTSYTRPSYYSDSNYADYPVIHVTWNQAVKFCQWRGGRLPSEAEWEKAARGVEGQRFPWGNEFDGSLTNFCDANCPLAWANPAFDDGQADTAPVGFYPGGASPYGLVDMAGNVWEWVSDWYLETFYDITPLQDPFGAESGQERVLRGGGWSYSGYYLHASFRGRNIPNNPTTYTGFRCVREP
jgi:formylglycine-generating enzyme required for sulfatase activity